MRIKCLKEQFKKLGLKFRFQCQMALKKKKKSLIKNKSFYNFIGRIVKQFTKKIATLQ